MKIKFTLTLFASVILFHIAAHAQCITGSPTAGSIFSNTSITGGSNWTQPQNAQASDNVYATDALTVGVLATVHSNYLTATGFGFNIPPTATICGVTVTVQHIRQDLLLGAINDNSVKLVSAGSIGGTDHASATDWSTTKSTVTYGGSTDTWGLALTPTIVNDANFGVGVSAKFTGGPLIALLLEGGIDYISIAITYNTPATSLAITLQDFSAVRQNNTDVLNWTATSNDAGDQFIVQRSGDAQNWQDLATIPVQTESQYTYTDNAPLNGNNFYRLYLANNNAPGVYSTIREVNQATTAITCYPNPFVSTINISSPKSIHSVVLRDLQGRTIQSRTIESGTISTGSNTLQLPAGTLPPGIYLLQVDGALFRMVKQ